MNEKEKEVYAQIFKFALYLAKNAEYTGFAGEMAKNAAILVDNPKVVLDTYWEMLKEYAGITVDDDGKWGELVERVDELSKRGQGFRRFGAVLLCELERRSRRGDGEHDDRGSI